MAYLVACDEFEKVAFSVSADACGYVSVGRVKPYPVGRTESLMTFGPDCEDQSGAGLIGGRVGGKVSEPGYGYCYLSIVRPEYVSWVRDVLGAWPSLYDLVEVPREMIDPDVMDRSRATVVKEGWHVSLEGDLSVARLLQLAAFRCSSRLQGDSLGFALLDLWFGDENYELDGFMGGVVPHSPELQDLYAKDFSQCRCLVHEVPVTKTLQSAALGCVQKPAGKSGVIACAFDGESRMCHADEATRTQDRKLLGVLLSDEDPGLLEGVQRSPQLAELCTSSIHSDMAAFGNGYCYLALLHHDTWWRAARLLGPNPLLRSLYRFVLWLGKPRSKRHKVFEVAPGYYHVAVDNVSKGMDDRAGRMSCIRIAEILSREPDARVGLSVDPPETGLDALVYRRTQLMIRYFTVVSVGVLTSEQKREYVALLRSVCQLKACFPEDRRYAGFGFWDEAEVILASVEDSTRPQVVICDFSYYENDPEFHLSSVDIVLRDIHCEYDVGRVGLIWKFVARTNEFVGFSASDLVTATGFFSGYTVSSEQAVKLVRHEFTPKQ